MSTPITPPKASPSDGTPGEFAGLKEAQTGHGLQQRAGPHHDGKAAMRVHAEQRERDHAGRIQADAGAHERAEHEIDPTAKPNCQPCKAMAVPPPGRALRFLAAKAVPAISKRDAHGDLNRPARQARHDAGAEPGPAAATADHGDQ